MRQLCLIALVGILSPIALHAQGKWVTVKGTVIWDSDKKPAPKQTPIKATKDQEVAAKDKEFLTEDWVVSPKTGGIKNVFVWLAPEPSAADLAALKARKLRDFPSFKPADINPALAKLVKDTVEIDQPCCRFIPHVLAAREGQKLVIKNSAPIPHNTNYIGGVKNGVGGFPFIMAGDQFTLPNPLVADRAPISLTCSIHFWMKAFVRVFDHPYFAVTGADGNFEIKDAPVLDGKLRIFYWQESVGFDGGTVGVLGESIAVKPGTVDLGKKKLNVPE
jgi:hypothetical protein